jgi:hypothetical protein
MSSALMLAVGLNVEILGGKVVDYWAYVLPCLAAICLGANLVREKSEKIIWLASIILLVGGFNFFLLTLEDAEFYFLIELNLMLAFIAVGLAVTIKHGMSNHPRIAKTLVPLTALLSVFIVGWAIAPSLQVRADRAATAENLRKIHSLGLSKHPANKHDQGNGKWKKAKI